MKELIILSALFGFIAGVPNPSNYKVVCYYDSRSYARDAKSQARMLPADLEPALPYCTHLIYGYAKINPESNKMVPFNENLDTDQTHATYKRVTALKAKNPGLKVLLSVGGDVDLEQTPVYNQLLESPQHRTALVNSGVLLAEQHGFDGIDLSWQFDKTKPKKIRGTASSLWHGFKKVFGSTPVDPKESEHREGFTALVREMKQALKTRPNMQLCITVLPNVNSSVYFDVPAVARDADIINLEAFDFATPERNPKEADYTGPLYTALDRNPLLNVDAVVQYWLTNLPSHEKAELRRKIVLGIPTYARTWKLTSDSAISGVPPIVADGKGPAGPDTQIEGLLSYPEVCYKLISTGGAKSVKPYLRKVMDPSKRFGSYAFRVPENDDGLWVSYEEPSTASEKALYAKTKELGGVSIVDLSLEDFRGLCNGEKYPLLRAAKYHLQ